MRPDAPPVTSVRALADDAIAALQGTRGRCVIGITGPPGAGKATLTEALVRVCAEELGSRCVVGLPMDGFHLPTSRLVEVGRHDRKGAPDTFDASGFVSTLRRLVDSGVPTMTWPSYSRRVHEPIPGAITVSAAARLVFVEGNYLLLPTAPWTHVRTIASSIWYVTADRRTLETRLLRRQLVAGRNAGEADRHVTRSDMLNVDQVERTRTCADRIVRVSANDPLLEGLKDPATGTAIELDDGCEQRG
jgi:pantothenate kinase